MSRTGYKPRNGATGGPDGGQGAPDRPRRRFWWTPAYLALLVAGIVAAWQVHVFWRSRSRPEPVAVDEYEPEPVVNEPFDWARMTPSELASRPWVGAGVDKVLERSPQDLPRIPGARFSRGVERVQDRYAYQHVSYQYKGTADEAAGQYVETLKARGFKLIRDATPKKARSARRLTFQSGRDKIVVSLRNGSEKDVIMTIGVMVVRPVR